MKGVSFIANCYEFAIIDLGVFTVIGHIRMSGGGN